MKDAAPLPAATLRLDKWLWFARFARSRSLAARLCEEGAVTIGGHEVMKPHHVVRVGDAITLVLPHQRRSLIVRGLGARRGPPAEARLLYDEPVPPVSRAHETPPWVSFFADEDEVVEA